MDEHDLPEEVIRGQVWGDLPDLTSMPVEDLRRRLDELVEEERKISYKRRVLQGGIDIIRAELVRRGGITFTPEELARVLLGNEESDIQGEEGES